MIRIDSVVSFTGRGGLVLTTAFWGLCAPMVGCVPPNGAPDGGGAIDSSTAEAICADVIDNDGDGMVDCDDPDCAEALECTCGNSRCDATETAANCESDCGGVCGGPLQPANAAFRACIEGACCDLINACNASDACLGCFSAQPPETCPSNTLYQAALSCMETNCPAQFCGTPFGDPINPHCNACVTQNCCTEWEACLAVGEATCVDCLNSGSCAADSVQALVDDYNACKAANCTTEC